MTIRERLRKQFQAIWKLLFSRRTGAHAVIAEALPICRVCFSTTDIKTRLPANR